MTGKGARDYADHYTEPNLRARAEARRRTLRPAIERQQHGSR